MGISRDLPNKNDGQISTFTLLLDIASSLRELINDPKAIESAVKQAYELSESEQALSRDIADKIKRNEFIIAENKELINDINSKNLEMAAHSKDLSEKIAELDRKTAALNKRGQQLDAFDSDLAVERKQLESDKESFLRDKDKLASDVAAFNEQKKRVDAQEAMLKDKAEQLRALTGNL